ncbi:hypothetical protein [Caulobacter sp. S45]|uniref:hypothetical protein n=1 Tax=Caulobacter sp. S45 TaxID=1641861 RepID=UPI0015757C1B|nr:hypothetical protein [Caulobacter sp. S45]
MGDVVIVAYRPKPGREAELQQLAREHIPYLRQLDLVTDRAPVLLIGEGGVIVEVFEWRDGAVEAAHAHPKVHELWGRYAQVCDYVPLKDLPEAAQMFATFKPLDG